MKRKRWTVLAVFAMVVALLPLSSVPAAAGLTDPVINEFVANHTGSDTEAFVEIFGDGATNYLAFTVLEIEGDTSKGVIDAVLPVGTTNAGGFWIDPEDMENGTITILLVENFTGSVGIDLDSNDDGTFDSTPWTRVVDDVATTDGGGSDLTYSSTVLGPFFDGAQYGAGGASRIPNGTDTNTKSDWVRNDFDGFGFPGFPGSPAVGEAENTPGAVNVAITVATDPVGVCEDAATLIHDIQGAGAASADVGNIREIEGVVVGDFQGSSALRGFFLQEEDDDDDDAAADEGDPLTSEGIFVYDGSSPGVDVVMGDVVRVRGSVSEYKGLTELTNVENLIVCGADTIRPTKMFLPVSSMADWEAVEGMLVEMPQKLHVSGNYNQGHYGEVDLSFNWPLDNPTNVVQPGDEAVSLQEMNDLDRIQLEDGSTSSNPPWLPYFYDDADYRTLRTGDTTKQKLTGVISQYYDYELHPTVPVDFQRKNPRPDGPPNVKGDLVVAAFNVLNYFTTLDTIPGSHNGPYVCGPNKDLECRGANNLDEFTRQRDKIVAAITKMDADVIGLMEIENYAGDVPTADLVAGLNNATAPGTYAYIATGAIGTDAIRQAIIYKPAAVTPVGDFAILDSSVDLTFDDTKNRPVIAQTFVENASGALFTVAVNHLKSKGSNCNSLGDLDLGDGQGNCNLTRTGAATALVNWLAGDPTGSGDPDFLITGDLNSYAMENPISAIESAGYTDLIRRFNRIGWKAGAYSYNFYSQSGYLDHALATPSLAVQVTGAAFWHINADEPSALDYNDYNQANLYQPDEFRSSDHDPVLVGLSLGKAPGKKK